MSAATIDASHHLQSESRISLLTLILGFLAAIPVAIFHNWRWGAGILIGAALAWLNFRWLRQGLDALTAAIIARPGAQSARVPFAAYAKALFRYGLIALCVYVIFKYLKVPVLSMIFGLCALGAAAFAVSVHEILRPHDGQGLD